MRKVRSEGVLPRRKVRSEIFYYGGKLNPRVSYREESIFREV